MKKGFTLIELLVVVLIIGVLSAVALPQYRKSVFKAKLAQADVLISAYKKAIQSYLLANGSLPANPDKYIWFSGSGAIGEINFKSIKQDSTKDYLGNNIRGQASCYRSCEILILACQNTSPVSPCTQVQFNSSDGNIWKCTNMLFSNTPPEWQREMMSEWYKKHVQQ
ncbi:MAG: prepilin-type N-terminal cleavage/methylation domain-containing protein [Elusimicrobiaceae bacterium]|nr:prepilin-type N-terminal cleavage/methylation domain-containing protein [Elusimicrobiaceae bacterium]